MTLIARCCEDLIANKNIVLEPTDWLTMTQERIDLFAEATGDFQWLHVDREAAKTGPFGTTIAHGYLSLSLTNYFLLMLLKPENLDWGVNYGVDRVRFPAPIRQGDQIRAHGVLTAVKPLSAVDVQTTVRMTIDIKGGEKPGCVADTIQRYSFLPEKTEQPEGVEQV
ncbi:MULTISPECIES: MaoC family dehydratase [unclassified Pseudovibrio]|uniref:MaoC family dehydratase n=1 Tax=unclassified Pseudovibrio TaxID=2627060 RepID=UPI00070E60B0|nr:MULTISPECIES: MaoC family dehydratase [unclassified Pseudovibrio]KZL15745.1 putative enoyl-CoA hydratase 1 [Pseudovibrio sp. Ad26]